MSEKNGDKYNDINDLVKFSSDVEKLNMKIDEIQTRLYTVEEDQEKGSFLSEGVGNEDFQASSLVSDFFRRARIPNSGDPSEIIKKISDLREQISLLPRIKIIFPFPRKYADLNFDKFLFEWFRNNLSPEHPILLEREYDPDILGGIQFYWQGRFYDLSLRTRLSNFYKKELSNVSG